MARDESAREDLMRDAKTLVERGRLRVDGFAEPVVAGFRRHGELSIFFGEEPAYHFDTAGRLRRAYADCLLYKAERGRLVAMRRSREAQVVVLASREMSPAESSQFLAHLRRRLDTLQGSLSAGKFNVELLVPEGTDLVARLTNWLSRTKGPIGLADSPRAGR